MYSPNDTSNDWLFNSSSSQFLFLFGDNAGQTGPAIVLHNQMMLQQQFSQYSATSNSGYCSGYFSSARALKFTRAAVDEGYCGMQYSQILVQQTHKCSADATC
ncbi:hypothetical protein EDC04DRAFT_2600556 [Pisolithus marmoratus]|nr:hypothetical protein EDC04DRAFT_2600556 [Pisolithus marmoratus]